MMSDEAKINDSIINVIDVLSIFYRVGYPLQKCSGTVTQSWLVGLPVYVYTYTIRILNNLLSSPRVQLKEARF